MSTKNKQEEKVDVLFLGAHQDDVDALVGGTVIRLTREGKKVEITDLTERVGMYYSEEEKWGREAETAAEIMGITRSNLVLSFQNHLDNTLENRKAVADHIRRKKPEVVVALNDDKTHHDHRVAHSIITDALHDSFATAIKTEHAPWKVRGVYFFPTNILYEPLASGAVYIDISSYFKRKMEALKAYASQMLFNIGNQRNLEYIESLNRSWGKLIGTEYAEAVFPRVTRCEPFPELVREK